MVDQSLTHFRTASSFKVAELQSIGVRLGDPSLHDAVSTVGSQTVSQKVQQKMAAIGCVDSSEVDGPITLRTMPKTQHVDSLILIVNFVDDSVAPMKPIPNLFRRIFRTSRANSRLRSQFLFGRVDHSVANSCGSIRVMASNIRD